MRVLVCGDRQWLEKRVIVEKLDGIAKVVIHGGNGYFFYNDHDVRAQNEAELMRCYRGADSLAHQAAKELGLETAVFWPNWQYYGTRAGPIRNALMLSEGKPDIVLAYHNDLSRSSGTIHMMTIAHKAGLPVLLCDFDDPYGLPWSPHPRN